MTIEERLERLERMTKYWCKKHNKLKDQEILIPGFFEDSLHPKDVCEDCKKMIELERGW